MESPVVLDKPPEYHGKAATNNERGFPFDEEEGSGAWSELAARHPDIAARLRQRPASATWARKRRPSSQDTTDDFGDGFSGFDRFPFDDIPPEFREHFPSRWNRRFSSRDESEPQTQGSPQPQSPSQQTTATQTEQDPGPSHHDQQQTFLPQYGLRNTVDLGQKSPADPSLVDAEERNQRSMSAPPDNRANNQNCSNKMNEQNQNHQEQQHPSHTEQQQPSNVRHIPIFVEGRDEPVINKSVDHGEPKQAYAPPPPQPHVDREQYFADEPVGFHPPPNFSRAFGTPFNTFRQGPQPFAQQKVYPQTAFARGASPQRSQSPKPNMYPEEHFVKVPVRHEFSKSAPPSNPKQQQRAQPQPQQQPQHQPQQQPHPQQHPPKQQTPPHQEVPTQQQQSPPQPKPQQTANDPISQILSIQTDVLNLMTDVENFTGSKKDKKYMYLDEMLTRNLIKLDNIETEGKENIRQARKEAIKCIQKCIAVLEAKADNKGGSAPQPQDVEMNENTQETNEIKENGEVEMKDTKEEISAEPQATQPENKEQVSKSAEQKTEDKPQEQKPEAVSSNKEVVQPEVADTRPVGNEASKPKTEAKQEGEKKEGEEKKVVKGAKNTKKRDKSKDKKATVDSNKEQIEGKEVHKVEEVMQVDDKGDKPETQTMEVDGAASQ
ncbi:LOW QUALITY PROTEIN: BAG domain-containing protein starvin [Aphomia sociella]